MIVIGSARTVEETLIREVLGWPIVENLSAPPTYPAASWSPGERCFSVRRSPADGPEPFRPTCCLRHAWEVQEALGSERFSPFLARPVWEGNVRLVASFGSKEIVVEARSLPWTLCAAIYQATRDGLIA